MTDTLERVEDYLVMGVRSVWIVDPRRKLAFSIGTDRSLQPEPQNLEVPGTPVRVPVAEIFAELDS